MSCHNGMCGWVQLISEHVSAHHSEIFESLGHTTISATPNSLIETVVPPSYKSLLRISSAASIAHTGNPMNTHWGLSSVQSECSFASNPFQAEVPKGFKMWVDYLDAKIPILTSATASGAFTKGCESIQHTTALATEVFEQYVTTRLSIVAARFEHKIDSVNKNTDWKWSLLDFCFRNIFNDTQRLSSILKADIQMAIQLGLNEIKGQLFSLMGEFQQKLLDEASTLDPTQLQMFTHGLHDHDRGASVLCHCQARQQDEPAEDSFSRGGPTPSIHDSLMKLPLHGKLVYQ